MQINFCTYNLAFGKSCKPKRLVTKNKACNGRKSKLNMMCVCVRARAIAQDRWPGLDIQQASFNFVVFYEIKLLGSSIFIYPGGNHAEHIP